MFEGIATFVTALNSLTPLGVIALLCLILFFQVKNAKTQATAITTLKTNDLHELPEMAAALKDISDTLRRVELSQAENFTYLSTKLGNGLIVCPFVKPNDRR